MSDPIDAPGNAQQQDDGGDKSGYTPPASQEELNRIISERVAREKAKFADYGDLKAKAARLDQIEQANLSEAEKVAQKIADAEAAVAQVPAKVADALRAHLVALHEINAEDAELFLTATDPELLLKQVQRLIGREADRKKTGGRAPAQGRTPSTGGNDPMREFTRNLFGAAAAE
jgi:hypothetical protein